MDITRANNAALCTLQWALRQSHPTDRPVHSLAEAARAAHSHGLISENRRQQPRHVAAGADGLRHATPASLGYLLADLCTDVSAPKTVPGIRLPRARAHAPDLAHTADDSVLEPLIEKHPRLLEPLIEKHPSLLEPLIEKHSR